MDVNARYKRGQGQARFEQVLALNFYEHIPWPIHEQKSIDVNSTKVSEEKTH